MEHEEIELDQKRNPRNKGRRYGVNGSGTIKFSKYYDRQERSNGEMKMFSPDESVTVSLNKRKNWEISQQSFDGRTDRSLGANISYYSDSDINTRVAISEKGEWLDISRQLYQPKAPTEEEPKVVSGTNRKGFFVREKRRRGKKGVNRTASSLSEGESSSDDSDTDVSENKEQDKDAPMLCIMKAPKPRQAKNWGKKNRFCNCSGCRLGGFCNKNVTDKNRKLKAKEAVELL